MIIKRPHRAIKTAFMHSFVLILLLHAIALSACAAPSKLELSGGRDWLNVSRPLTSADLNGRVVLLDFWTFCCINCMHIIPDLKYLEEKFGDRLLVIGVHSAKFSNEQASENIRNAILRYEIHHPVLNDADFTVWNRYGVNAWPTFLLFSADGQLALNLSGEGQRARLERAIASLLEKTPPTELPPLPLKAETPSPGVLSFPGKVLADDTNHRIFVSNSSAHSILEISESGEILNQIGNAKPGLVDGPFQQARFGRPQGLALTDGLLYIADTENNAIRVADLAKNTVSTLISKGISSPWDIVVDDKRLLVAMAGSHQIWEVDRTSGQANALIGTGREDLVDGDFLEAALAQPSGLALAGRKLYIADSEVSAIREADLDTKRIKTIIGHGLFDFGDKDGELSQARLQHPLGVTLRDGKLIVADSYNHKLRQIDLASGTITSIAGSGRPDELSEPGGITRSSRGILVADTNNNRLRILGNDGKLVTLGITKPSELQSLVASELPNLEKITHATISFKTNTSAKLRLKFILPDGYHINQEAPSQLTWWRGDSEKSNLRLRDSELSLVIPNVSGNLRILATIYYCPIADGSTCEIKSFDVSAVITETATVVGDQVIELFAKRST